MSLLVWTFTVVGIGVSFVPLLFSILQYFNKRGSPKILVVKKSFCWGISVLIILYVIGLFSWVKPEDDPTKLDQIQTDVQQIKESFRKYDTKFFDQYYGAGVVFTSPEYEKRTTVHLNACIRFDGFGKMTYISDLIFKLYYNDRALYFVPEDGEVVFEYQLPSIRYRGPMCISAFNENDRFASEEFPALESFFESIK